MLIWEIAENLPRAPCFWSLVCSSCNRCVFWAWQGPRHRVEGSGRRGFPVYCELHMWTQTIKVWLWQPCSCSSPVDKQVGESRSSSSYLLRGQSWAHGDASEPGLLPNHVWGEESRLQGSWGQTPYGENKKQTKNAIPFSRSFFLF